MKKSRAVLPVVCFFLVLFFAFPLLASAQDDLKVRISYIKPTKHELKFAHGLTVGSPYDKGANRFAELVEVIHKVKSKLRFFRTHNWVPSK
jgi:TRAP-type C4-dicarboxylate transport system substrate-binding protein